MEYYGILIVCNKVAIFIYKKKERNESSLSKYVFLYGNTNCWTLSIIIYKKVEYNKNGIIYN